MLYYIFLCFSRIECDFSGKFENLGGGGIPGLPTELCLQLKIYIPN